MRSVRWISMILMLTVLLSGCASAAEEFGVADSLAEIEQNDQRDPDTPKKEPDREQTPAEPEPDQPEDPKDEAPADETPAGDVPVSDEEPDQEPSQEPEPDDPAAPDEGDEESEPITKEESGIPITFLVHNVMHSGQNLAVKGDGEGNELYNRLHRFKSEVQTHQPDVILFQEAKIGTIQFFQSDDPYFSQLYTVHYKYRWPEVPGGDMAEPVIWKTAKYACVERGFFWLSETPDRPSKCYDAKNDYGNIASWAILKDKATGVSFYVCSAHGAGTGNGEYAPYGCMEQFFNELRNLEDGMYGFVGGDFNIDYRSFHYNDIWDFETIVDLQDMAKNMFNDGLCQLGGTNGSINCGYEEERSDPNPGNKKQLDHMIAKPNPHMAVDYWGFDYTEYDHAAADVQKGHISDHYGLIVKVRIDTEVDYSRYQKQHEG